MTTAIISTETVGTLVRAIFSDSLFTDAETRGFPVDPKPSDAPAGSVIVEGIMATYAFHAQRLESHRSEVKEILEFMDPSFRQDVGGGYSFLALPFDRTGGQWGEHRNCEQLIVLAMGLGLAKYCLPRSLWSALPGSMPYVVFDLGGAK